MNVRKFLTAGVRAGGAVIARIVVFCAAVAVSFVVAWVSIEVVLQAVFRVGV